MDRADVIHNRIEKTMDGNAAAAHVAYAFTQVAPIYPITPSSPMAEIIDEWAVEGRENLFGETVKVVEMQSEAGAAATLHGTLSAGVLATTFTASQGLLLMLPNIYKVAGELLPGVFHVAARTVASHALSIFGDHSDVYACRQSGVAMLASGSVQEVMDLAAVAHLSAIKGRVPFIHFFDGFRTSHEVKKIKLWDYDELKSMLDMDALEAFRERGLDPEHAFMAGAAQNPDIFFQVREAANNYYTQLIDVVCGYFDEVNKRLGTNYGLFDYYGSRQATHVIVAMGSVTQTIEEVCDFINSYTGTQKSEAQVGLVKVHLYRPFSVEHFLKCIPDTVEQITVLDRTKEAGSVGEPLFVDVIAALKGSRYENVPVYGGRYGLSSKDTTPEQIMSVYANHVKRRFTIGIEDDVTGLSLNPKLGVMSYIGHYELPDLDRAALGCVFWGLGGDGTIGANKNSIKIIGNNTDLQVQGYFSYDSKKSGGVTVSHLRFGKNDIRSAYLVRRPDFVACHNQSYILKYDMLSRIKQGGVFLLNCDWEKDELESKLPDSIKHALAVKKLDFYIINAVKIGKEIGINGKINTILQSAFFKIVCDRYADRYGLMSYKKAVSYMKSAAKSSYAVKGEKIVEMNYRAIELGGENIERVEVPKCWEECPDKLEKRPATAFSDRQCVEEYVENIQYKVNAQEGDELPVSTFLPYVDGRQPSGTAAHEKRDFAVELPEWVAENCIQCNRCSYVCPHAVIRPAVLDDDEIHAQHSEAGTTGDMQNTHTDIPCVKMNAMPDKHFAIVISSRDCTGCGSCAGVCPGMNGNKALVMTPVEEYDKQRHQREFDYAQTLSDKPEVMEKFKVGTVKGSQFRKPLMEFSGACAGCGETPYAKLATQLFGERMYIANATGCTSIWANSTPATAYTAYKDGRGPAWSNSLFEDAAEFGYGIYWAEQVKTQMKYNFQKDKSKARVAAAQMSGSNIIANDTGEDICEAEKLEDDVTGKGKRRSVWIFGGDGWAYDIGYGGLDHILASGENINILVFDTEVYSNTGGQASKATPKGAYARFAADGKRTPKKKLARMAMTYGNVYVAQVAMGADYEQTVKAFTEAESYNGPSLIIAYCTCIAHGIKAGMGSSQAEELKAVSAGYWSLFRYNPALAEQGENPLIIDSKEPTISYEEFLAGEIRYRRR